MRKITKESAKAFVNFEPYKKDNTEIEFSSAMGGRVAKFYLHGNLIAKISQTGNMFQDRNHESGLPMLGFSVDHQIVKIDLCGYHTRTTRERINGVLDALGYDFRIAQRKGEQVLVKTYVHNYLKPKQVILKLSDDSFDPDFAEKVFLSSEFVSGTDLNAIADF